VDTYVCEEGRVRGLANTCMCGREESCAWCQELHQRHQPRGEGTAGWVGMGARFERPHTRRIAGERCSGLGRFERPDTLLTLARWR
jgi:hypothetical protein